MQVENHAMKNINAQILSCLDTLHELQQSIIKQQWQMLVKHTQSYENEVAKLNQIMKHGDKSYQKELQSLYYSQRRIMRLIYQAQQQTHDAIISADEGKRKVKRLSSLVS
jgi:hypothetical protein